jgi:hypothetical protein
MTQKSDSADRAREEPGHQSGATADQLKKEFQNKSAEAVRQALGTRACQL